MYTQIGPRGFMNEAEDGIATSLRKASFSRAIFSIDLSALG